MLCAPPEDTFHRLMLKCLQIDEKGFQTADETSRNEVKEIKKLQKAIIAVEEIKREIILNQVAKSLFGIDLEISSLSLSEKVRVMALLANSSTLDETVNTAAISKAQKKDRAMNPGVPWARRDILDLKGPELAGMKIEDIIKAPGVWKESLERHKAKSKREEVS